MRKKLLKKYIRIIISILAAVVILSCMFTFSACKSSNTEEADYYIYYSNSSNDDVVKLDYYLPGKESMNEYDITGKLLGEMLTNEREDGVHYSPLPKDVNLNGYTLNDGVVTLDFDAGYNNMTNVQEHILKAAVVLTLVQVEGVSAVQFTVDGNPIKDSDGNEVGYMNANQYVNILLSDEGMLRQETILKIYFATKDGSMLFPSSYKFTLDNKNQSLEEYILQQLIMGPVDENALATLDPDVELLGVSTSNKTCYVNFGQNFLEQKQKVSDEIMIYSIVNSLCQLAYVNSVQFLVDGDTNVVLHRTWDLSQPVSKNEDYIMDMSD